MKFQHNEKFLIPELKLQLIRIKIDKKNYENKTFKHYYLNFDIFLNNEKCEVTGNTGPSTFIFENKNESKQVIIALLKEKLQSTNSKSFTLCFKV